MDKLTTEISIELLTYGRRKIIPVILDTLSILGFLGIFTLMILQKNNIFFNHLIEIIVVTLLLIGIVSFMVSAYALLNWDINQLRQITGKIKLTERNIEINESFINIENVEKIYLKASNTRGATRGSDGTNNKIVIKTSTNTLTQKFIIESRKKREHLENYALFLKTQNIIVFIEGIDLK